MDVYKICVQYIKGAIQLRNELTESELEEYPMEASLEVYGFKEIVIIGNVKQIKDMGEFSNSYTIESIIGPSICVKDIDKGIVHYRTIYDLLRDNYHRLNDHNPILDFCSEHGIKYRSAMCIGVKLSVNVQSAEYELTLNLEDPEFMMIQFDWNADDYEIKFDINYPDTIYARTVDRKEFKSTIIITKNIEEVFDRIHVVKK